MWTPGRCSTIRWGARCCSPLCGKQPPRGFGLQLAPPAPDPAQGSLQARPASASWLLIWFAGRANDLRAACAAAAPRPPASRPAPRPAFACPPFDRRAFGRERPGLCRFLPTALTEAEVDEVDIDEPGFEAWPSAEPWAEAVAALEGYTLEEVVGAEVVGAESAPSSPEQSAPQLV